MVRLNLNLDNIKNRKETTMFVNKRENIIKGKKKGVFNSAYKQGHLFKKSKESDKLKKMHEKIGVSKTRKSVAKASKTQSGNEFE